MTRILIVARNKNFPLIGMHEAFSIHKDILQRMETPATESPQDATINAGAMSLPHAPATMEQSK